jgi:mannose-6-phosphate isomerase-like protein (cupin superfamily)
MKSFTHLGDVDAVVRSNEHGGVNEIFFRRLCAASDFKAPIDFVDFTLIPPGSTIGWHSHHGNEEAYFIASGSPVVRVENDTRRLKRGDIAVVRSGQSHELINDTEAPVEILVVQVRLAPESPA